jgi:hypothetical protein
MSLSPSELIELISKHPDFTNNGDKNNTWGFTAKNKHHKCYDGSVSLEGIIYYDHFCMWNLYLTLSDHLNFPYTHFNLKLLWDKLA